MESWGLILSGVGAILVAIGQYEMSSTIKLWLMSLQLMSENPGEQDVLIVRGVDRHMERSLKLGKWLNGAGWPTFVLGIAIQTVPYFRERGWGALALF